ncbi:retention module-containing protein [Shewanella halifaxensis]|uniref:retention module-containing protein n=1 Tax=Shewanella halifaxensis TaxID=271098 RepID=UPI000D59D34A|nr:retention module-containing protein [Shewanella halifaxensis]
MKSIITTQVGYILNLNGVVTANIDGNTKQLIQGDVIPAGTDLLLADSSSIEIKNSDGSILTSEQATSISEDQALNEIAEIQALIAAGEDPTEGPDTAAGGQTGNEGSSSHVSIARIGEQTIASSGFDTNIQQNNQNTENNDSLTANGNTFFDSPTVTINDTQTITEDGIATGNVLNNDSDIDSNLSVTSFEVNGETYAAGTTVVLDGGSLVINADGSYTFTPNADWNGTVPVISYTTNTGETATLTLEVTAIDDPSIVVNDSQTIAEDQVTTGNVLANDSDIDSDLSVTSFEVNGETYAAGTTVVLDGGSLVINADGSYTFTPNADWNGTVPVISYTTNTGESATLTLEVTAVDDPSVVANDSQTIAEDQVATGNVLANDSDIDSDLSVTSFEVNGETYAAGTTVALDGGSLVINADGSYTFTPNADWNGTVPVISYTTNTGESATLTLEVTAVDDPSVVANDSQTIAEDQVATGNVLANDSDIDSDLSVTSFEVNGGTYAAGTTVVLDGGSVVINADGSYTFTPNADWNGTVPVITYSTNTGETATLTLEVTPVDDASKLENDSNTVVEDTIATGNVLENDTDIDNDLSVDSFEVNGNTYLAGTSVTLEGGSLVINQDGSYTFTPNDDWNGTVPVITYNTNTGETATLTLEVTPVDDASKLENDSNTVVEDTIATGNVLENDTDIDNDLSVDSFEVNGNTYVAGTSVTLEGGSLVINQDGSYTFTPNDDWNGTVPVITYITNTNETATLALEVTAVNDEPVAADDNFSVNEGSMVSGNMITHDDGDGVVDNDGGDGANLSITHINGQPLSFNPDGWSNPIPVANGTMRVKADGSFEFSHDGSDPTQTDPSFTYTLSDGTDSDVGTVSFDVTAVNDEPVAADDNFSVNEGSMVSGNMITHDDGDGVVDNDGGDGANLSITHINGQPLSFNPDGWSNPIPVANGTVRVKADGSFEFSHDGSDPTQTDPSFTYTLSDGTDSDVGTVSFDVTAVNDEPVAADDNFSVNEGSMVSGNMITHDDGDGVVDNDGGDGANLSITHINGQPLSFNPDGWSNPIPVANGTVRVKADGSFEFSHDGSDPTQTDPSFTYTLSDGTDSDVGTVSFDVTAVNDEPVAADDNFNVNEGSMVSGNMITHDDGDGVVDNDGGDGANLSITHINGQPLSFNPDGWSNPIPVANGTVRVKADGSFEFSHDGSDPTQTDPSFTYTLSDGTDSDVGTVSFDVTAVNDEPVAADDNFSVNEGSMVSGNMITHDDGDGVVDNDGGDGANLSITHINGQPLSFNPDGWSNPIPVANGTVRVKADGSFEFSHDGSDPTQTDPSFTYTLSDGTDSDVGTVSFDVTAVNDEPVAADDNFSVNEGSMVSGNMITHDDGDGVVDNDGGDGANLSITHINGQPLSFNPDGWSNPIPVANGTVRVKADGSFEFSHDGSDPTQIDPSFTYTLSDGTDSDVGTVSFDVNPIDDTAPIEPTVTILDDNAVIGANEYVNDGWLNADEIASGGSGVQIQVNVDHAELDDGGFVTLTISNGNLVSTVTLSLNDDGDLVVNGSSSTASSNFAYDNGVITWSENTPNEGQEVSVSATQTDEAGNSSTSGNDTAAVTTVNAVDDAQGTSFSASASSADNWGTENGTQVNPLFTISARNADGSIGSVNYQLSDNNKLGVSGNPRSDNSSGVGQIQFDSSTGQSEAIIFSFNGLCNEATFDVSNMFYDEAGGEQGVWKAYYQGQLVAMDTFKTEGSNSGTFSINTGNLVFDTLVFEATYTVDEASGIALGGDSSDYYLTSIEVSGPALGGDALVVNEGESLSATAAEGLLANDSDQQGHDFAITSVNGTDFGQSSSVNITFANGATITVNADGSYTFNTNGAYDHLSQGELETLEFNYTITDEHGAMDTATVTINIVGTNDAPIAVGNNYEVNEGASITGNLITDDSGGGVDSDAESNTLTITHINGLAVDFSNGNATIAIASGSLTISPDGTFIYIHDGSEPVPTEFTYTISDGNKASDTATVTLNVNGVNDDPNAVANSYNVNEGSSAQGNLITDNTGDGIDYDADGDTLYITHINGVELVFVNNLATVFVAGGSLSIDINGNFTYNHDGSASTPVSFSYTISDRNGGFDTSDVVLNINEVNNPVSIENIETLTVHESALATGSGGGTLTDSGTFSVTAKDGIAKIEIGNSTLTLAMLLASSTSPISIAGANGTLTITGYDNGVISYDYTLNSQQDHAPSMVGNNVISDNFNVTVYDTDNDSASTVLTANIVDDIADAKNDSDSVDIIVDNFLVANVEAVWSNHSGGENVTTFDGFDGVDEDNTNHYGGGNDNDNGHDQIRWGVTNGKQSGYGFIDNDTTLNNEIALNQDITLGTFTHYNYPVNGGTAITSATMTITFTIKDAYGVDTEVTLEIPFVHTETPNNGTPEENRDIIKLGTPQVTFEHGGEQYTIQVVGFRETNQPNGEVVTEIYTAEDQSTSYDIVVKVVEGNGYADPSTEGNVLNNDITGADTDISIIGVAAGDTTATGASGGVSTVINGVYGTILLTADGSYTYTVTAEAGSIPSDAKEYFTYTIKDGDGDTSSALLTISVNPIDGNGVPIEDANKLTTIGGTLNDDFIILNGEKGANQDQLNVNFGGSQTGVITNQDGTKSTTAGANLKSYSTGNQQVVSSGNGNDHIETAKGNDIIYAGETGADGFGSDDEIELSSSTLLAHHIMTGTLRGSDSMIDSDGLLLSNDVSSAKADVVNGGSGHDMIFGQSGSDILYGHTGNDLIDGGSHNDGLRGGAGNDILIGGLGDDVLRGDNGADTFLWDANSVDGTDTTDHITDFDLTEDKLDLSDILQGDSVSELLPFIEFTDVNGSTSINIDTDQNGSFDQHIVLDGVDLFAQFGNNESDIISGLLGNNGDGPLIVSTSSGEPLVQSVNTPDPVDELINQNGINIP